MNEAAASTAASAVAPPLEVRGASKRYGDVVALDDVSFTVEGGVYGLLGANGAGKSTLFRTVLDLVPLDAGSIHVAGHDARLQGPEARRHVGYLPEELRLYERLTGGELLELVAGLRGVDDEAAAARWLEVFGMVERRDVLIAEYSLGMRKKIGLAAALLGTPPLVLLDEPLNGLDTESMRRLRLEIEALAAAGTTFVLSSHVMAFVERVCDRMAVLRRGRLVAEGDADALRREAGLPDAPFEDVFLRLAVD